MLACSECGTEQPHRVRYRQDTVVEMSCSECGRTINLPRAQAEPDLTPPADGKRRRLGRERGRGGSAGLARAPKVARTLGETALGLSVRAATKPIRLWRQVRREGADALRSMPRRAATKPLRLARELQDDVEQKMRDGLS